MPACFALFDGDGGSALLLSEGCRSIVLDTAADPVRVFDVVERALAAGNWVALAADYALGASLEPILAKPPPGRTLLRAWVFEQAEWLDPPMVHTFLAEQVAGLPEYQRLAGIAELSPGVDAAKHAEQVRQIGHWIADGDCYQINLTFPLTFRIYGHPLALYTRLRERQPLPQ